MYKQQHILFIGFVWPEPDSSAAGLRTINLIKIFRSLGWKITFASSASDSEFEFDLSSIEVDKKSIELNNSSFDTFVKELNPSIVIFDRFVTEEQFGWRVAEQCPKALRVLDTIDLQFLRRSRQQAVKENREFLNDDLFTDTAKREIASILRCDLSLIISDFEMSVLIENFKINPNILFYLPLIVDQLENPNWKNYEERENFIFIGNFYHEPNWDCVLYLKNKIWKGVRNKLPDTNLLIYGAYPSDKVYSLHNPKEGFCILGRAENSYQVLNIARVCLAPLRYGAGIKGKLLDSMLTGTPSVTTTIGAEAMVDRDLDWNGYITNNPEEFIEKAVELYTNKSTWLNSQENGIKIVNTRFNKNLYIDSFIKKLIHTQENQNFHKKENFIGEILLYHMNSSTKYLAKWIEEKNNK